MTKEELQSLDTIRQLTQAYDAAVNALMIGSNANIIKSENSRKLNKSIKDIGLIWHKIDTYLESLFFARNPKATLHDYHNFRIKNGYSRRLVCV